MTIFRRSKVVVNAVPIHRGLLSAAFSIIVGHVKDSDALRVNLWIGSTFFAISTEPSPPETFFEDALRVTGGGGIGGLLKDLRLSDATVGDKGVWATTRTTLRDRLRLTRDPTCRAFRIFFAAPFGDVFSVRPVRPQPTNDGRKDDLFGISLIIPDYPLAKKTFRWAATQSIHSVASVHYPFL
uniref:Uncharacterized protein n=1 Tax=Romanomermis culicivorax TaxID=13658 RepID=A0A915L3K5_ROMCU